MSEWVQNACESQWNWRWSTSENNKVLQGERGENSHLSTVIGWYRFVSTITTKNETSLKREKIYFTIQWSAHHYFTKSAQNEKMLATTPSTKQKQHQSHSLSHYCITQAQCLVRMVMLLLLFFLLLRRESFHFGLVNLCVSNSVVRPNYSALASKNEKYTREQKHSRAII